MNGGAEHSQVDREGPAPALAGPKARSEAELDLDRLVWDPEYRASVRHLFKTGR